MSISNKQGTDLLDFLDRYAEAQPVRFHVPGHKGGALFRRLGYESRLSRLADKDLTEIPGADNLHDPRGVLKDLADRYARLYGVDQTFLLVNGSTVGILAAIRAAVRPGGTILTGRASHQSVFHGIELAGASPAFIVPEADPAFGVPRGLTAEDVRRGLREHPDAQAVFITSPDYFGTLSDVRGIADEAHRAGVPLLVDQAHGAHLILTQPGGAAERSGADVVIDSTHKTMASFTQTALLHVQGGLVSGGLIARALRMLESSSPSYLLLASLAANADITERFGGELAASWLSDVRWFRQEAAGIPGLRIYAAPAMDETRIVLDASRAGFSGGALSRALEERGVYPEMSAGDLLVLETGIGNVRRDYEILTDALRRILGSAGEAARGGRAGRENGLRAARPDGIPPYAGVPAHAGSVPLRDAAGLVSAACVVPYPPGIPLLCPGEIIRESDIRCLEALKKSGTTVLGLAPDGTVVAGK